MPVGLVDKHQHRWGQRRLKPDVAVHVDDGQTIKEDVNQGFEEDANLAWDQHQQGTDGVDVEEEFWRREFVGLGTTIPQIVGHDFELRTEPAQGEHKDEEGAVIQYRTEQPANPLQGVDMVFATFTHRVRSP